MERFSESEDLVRQEVTVYFCQLAEAFGLPRSIALIYAALYLAEEPLAVAEVIEKSGLSKGSVSHGLRLLERMKFIHPVISPTDRRSFYRPELSLRKLAIGLVEESFLPALKMGGGLLDDLSKVPVVSGHLKSRLVSLQRWNETALGLLPALSLLD